MSSKIASNYSPLPIQIVKGKDIFLWDEYGKKYVDLLAGYSAINQGHCHPKIVKELIRQSKRLTLSSRVVNTNQLFQWADYVTHLFHYDKVLAMNSGAEAVETALKLARKYGRTVLNIPHPYIVCLGGNFHGRTLGTISLSDYSAYKNNFGPFIEDIITIPMNDEQKLHDIFQKRGASIAAILYEPIQGEGGVVPIKKEFIDMLRLIKGKYHHVLLMADEIQCGLGRTGYLTTSEKFNLKPDVLILGKALSGGILPMSCILADKDKMDIFTPGTHGSTFGGNPLACAISKTALSVIQKECIPNVKNVSSKTQLYLSELLGNHKCIKDIRGTGLFWGVQFHTNYSIENLRLRMLEKGYITCTSRYNTLRITPPLTISIKEISKAIYTLKTCL
jgi:ornithine--oxo-acid transaminase